MGQLGALRLEPCLWQSFLGDFLYSCAGSAPAEQAERIREAWYLLRAAPRSLSDTPHRLPGTIRLEALLAAEAYESAALALLGPEWGYMLSRGPGGACLATIMAPGRDEDATAQGATPALALMAALALALAASDEPKAETVEPVNRLRIGSEPSRRG